MQIGPLLIITAIFQRACRPVFQKPMSVLSLRTAVDMDHNDSLKNQEIPLEEESADPGKEVNSEKVTYLMPAMDFRQRRHESVLGEAADMDLVLDGKKVSRPWDSNERDRVSRQSHVTQLSYSPVCCLLI